MAQLGTTFDATTVDPNKPFEVYPAGDYIMQAILSEIRSVKSGEGQYLFFEFEVLEGEYTGRKWWERLNLWNNNAQTVEIAQGTLSAMCHATGVMQVDDSDLLLFKPMLVKMRATKRKDSPPPPAQPEYENRANYLPLPGTPQATALAARTPAPAARTAAPAQAARPTPPTRQAAPAPAQQAAPAQPQTAPQPAAAPGGAVARPWAKHRAA